MIKYIVYQTTCVVNNKIYIGVHKTYTPEKFDGYLGCDVDINRPQTMKNPKWPIQLAIKKHGYKNFIRVTLKEFDTSQEAYDLEKELVTIEFIRRHDTYNACPGGIGGAAFCNMVAVHQYKLNGDYVASYTSMKDAVIAVSPGSQANHISRSIKLNHMCMGFQWSFDKVDKMPVFVKNKPYERQLTEEKPIGRYDLKTNQLIETYPHLRACVTAGYKNAKAVLLGDRASCKGFNFKYLYKD